MAREIERKYLATPDAVPRRGRGRRIRQFYFRLPEGGGIGRVRCEGGRYVVTLKSGHRGISRREIEGAVPRALGRELERLLCAAGGVVKRRFVRRWDGRRWEVDVFEGDNRGLILAEVELRRSDERVVPPPWVAVEVTHDRRFDNASLAERPWRRWPERERAAAKAGRVAGVRRAPR